MDLSLAESSPELPVADLYEPAAKKARKVHFWEVVLDHVGPVAGAVKGKNKRKKTKGRSGTKHKGKGEKNNYLHYLFCEIHIVLPICKGLDTIESKGKEQLEGDITDRNIFFFLFQGI